MRSIKIFIAIVALCCMAPALAQKTFGSDKYSAMCNYYGEEATGDIIMVTPSPVAESVVQDIMSTIGLRANFELRAANVPTAAAVIKQGKRYIMYNPDFMNKVNSATGSDWAAISILAHEIGHHLNGHTLDNIASKPATELEADEFSGFVLQKMGASLQDAQAVMALIASQKGSHTHPPKNQRLTYIANGWNKAAGMTVPHAAIAQKQPAPATPQKMTPVQKPAPPQKPVAMQRTQQAKQAPKQTVAAAPKQSVLSKEERIRQSVLNDHYIASDAYFSTNPGGQYYITVRGNFVMVDKDKVYMLGSLAKSDKNGYELMLYGENTNIYIDSSGGLVNNTGKKVGYLKARE